MINHSRMDKTLKQTMDCNKANLCSGKTSLVEDKTTDTFYSWDGYSSAIVNEIVKDLPTIPTFLKKEVKNESIKL